MRLLLIGCGYWGTKLAERLGPKVQGIYLYDINAANRKTLVEKLGFGNPEQVELEVYLEEVDAVVIATPPDTHYDLASLCVEAGKHVLVEKPMTLDAKEGRELVYLAQKKRVTLMTDDTFLYSPWGGADVTGLLARTLEAHWTGPRPHDKGTPEEGILWTLGPHPVSLMLHCMGRYPVGITGEITPRRASLLYSFVGGDEASIFMDWDTPGRERYLWYRTHQGDSFVDFDAIHAVEGADPLKTMCQTFLHRVDEASDPEIGPWIDYHGLMVVEILKWTEKHL